METPESLARRYVELSNEGDLERVWEMFHSKADYVSSQVGTFRGIDAIREMMGAFFTKYESPYWDVDRYERLGDESACFGFRMSARVGGGEVVHRRGVETIRFDLETGKIVRIEVEVAPD